MNTLVMNVDWSLAAWIGMAMKGGVVLAGAGVVVSALHRSSASYRHLAWAVALMCLPLLTVLSFVGPAWRVPAVPESLDVLLVSDPGGALVVATVASAPSGLVDPGAPDPVALGSDAGVPVVSPISAAPLPWATWLFTIWALAAGVICLPLAIGLFSLLRVGRTARSPDDGYWDELLDRSRRDLGLTRSVRILEHEYQTMPMTWGTIQATVMLPSEARTWSPPKRRAVMLHELAHVQRFDYLTRVLARIGLALHLFNPLAWIAWRRMRTESERACDDRVLAAGADPADYADHLIQIAQRCLASFGSSAAAVTMARKSQLEGRILAVLDAARNRAGVGRTRLALSLALTAVIILPISAIRLVAQAPMRHFVRVVVEEQGLSFQGELVDWEQLEQRLATVTNRSDTVLELALATEEMTVRRWNETRSRAMKLSEAHGFEYVSEVGLHPMASVGSDSQPREESEGSLATQRQAAIEDGDLPSALGLEMQRVKLRGKNGHSYKDKISLDGSWADYRDRHQPGADEVRGLMNKVAQWAEGFSEDSDYTWRAAHVLAAMAVDAGDSTAALTWMERSLDAYPDVSYSTPSKHSKFQHLVNYRAGLLWDANGPGDAAEDALERLATDPRFEYFFIPWWENEVERRGIQESIDGLKHLVLEAYQKRVEAFPKRSALTREYMTELRASLPGASTSTDVTPAQTAPALGPDGPLQQQIDQAQSGDTLVIPPGIHPETLVISKALTLRGESRSQVMLKVKADRPAIEVRTDQPVVIENLTIEWQRASSQNPGRVLAGVAATDGDLTIVNCEFSGDAGYERCPAAVVVDGFMDLELRGCVFGGFAFAVQVSGGAKGRVIDCTFVKPGHCGLTSGRGAVVTAEGNLVAGSLFHGMRCTGGTLNARGNLIIANKNRGIYLGNRAAHGLIENNVILGNATGISVFGGSDNTIRNNLLLDNTFAGLDARSLCPITVEANILQGNNQGVVVWEESAAPATIRLGGNTFWQNASNDVLRIDMPAEAALADAGFADAATGDFSRSGASGPGSDHGLSDPAALRPVWERWTAVAPLLKP